MKKIILNGTLLLMSCVVALVIFEGLLRYFEPVPMRLKGNKIQLTTNQTLIFEPENSEAYSKFDPIIRHSKNSLGFRGEEPPLAFAQHLSIMTVGGSTTECYYLSDGKTWPDVLKNNLGKNFNQVWVNNAGLDGHSTFGHIHLLKDYIADIRPKIILYLVGINDVGLKKSNPFDDSFINVAKFWSEQPDPPSLWDAIKKRDGVLAALSYFSETANLALNIARSMKATTSGMGHAQLDMSTLTQVNVSEEIREKELQHHREEFLPSYEARLRQLVNLTKKVGIEPVLITQPALWGDTIDPSTGVDLGAISSFYGDRLDLYNDVTRRIGKEFGILVIDLAEMLPDDSKYYYDMFHFTNLGAEKVANLVSGKLAPWLTMKYPGYAQ